MFLLLLSALDADDRAFAERLFESHKDKIYSIAYGILKNHHDAEDTVDEVMIRIIKNISKFSGKSCHEIGRQIVIYTRNTAIDIYRKNRLRAEHEAELFLFDSEGDEEEVELPDTDCNIEQDYINSCTCEMLVAAMNDMKPIYKDALKLRVLMDYSYDEIAIALNISPDLARKRCERARKLLQELCGKEYEGVRDEK